MRRFCYYFYMYTTCAHVLKYLLEIREYMFVCVCVVLLMCISLFKKLEQFLPSSETKFTYKPIFPQLLYAGKRVIFTKLLLVFMR